MRLAFLALALLTSTSLAACSPNKPWLMEDTNVNTDNLRLIEGRHVMKKPVAEYNDEDMKDAAYKYKRQGAGPVYIAVAYNGTTGKGVDQATSDAAQKLAMGLVENGVTEKIIVSTVQMEGATPVAIIAFDTLTVAGPADCEGRPSMEQAALANNDGEDGYNYRLGCGVKNIMAQQIAYAADTEGQDRMSPADAERVSNIVNNDYRKGETHDYLPSYIISELAGQGG